MKPIPCVSTTAESPEHLVVELTDSGLMGGDSGHGGLTCLTFSTESGCNTAVIYYPDGVVDEVDLRSAKVSIVSRGDWEQESMYNALVQLGRSVREARKEQRVPFTAPKSLDGCYTLRDSLESELTTLSAKLDEASKVPSEKKTAEARAWFGRTRAKARYLRLQLLDTNRKIAKLRKSQAAPFKAQLQAAIKAGSARVKATKAKYLAVIDKQHDLVKLLRAEVGEEKFKALTEIVNERWNA